MGSGLQIVTGSPGRRRVIVGAAAATLGLALVAADTADAARSAGDRHAVAALPGRVAPFAAVPLGPCTDPDQHPGDHPGDPAATGP